MKAFPFFYATLLSCSIMAQTGHIASFEKISGTQGNLQVPLINNSRFGDGLAEIGDLNNDGVPDLAVGAHDAGFEGRVHILFMNTNGSVNSYSTIGPNIGGFNGVFPNDMGSFGAAIAGLGDLNGDGVEDIVVGNPQGDVSDRGEIYILFLNANGTVSSYVWIAEGQGFTGSLPSNAYFGSSVANVGDLNGDAVTDIAVGAIGGPNGGALWILFLDSAGVIVDQQKIDYAQGNFTGDLGPGAAFGSSVANLGDLNGDGSHDVIVGARSDTSQNPPLSTGSVWVLFLDSNGMVLQNQKISSGSGGFSDSLDLGGFFGFSAANIGDVDGDGVTDVIVGANFQDEGGTNRGAAWILFMNPTGTINGSVKIAGQTNGFTPATVNSDELGRAVCGIGDLDGDNRYDVVISRPNDDDGGSNYGSIYILHLNGPTVLGTEQPLLETTNTTVYPNPSAAGMITVQTGEEFSIGTYCIHDALGQVVTEGKTNSATFTVDLSAAEPGCYVLTLQSDGREQRRKIILQGK